MAMMGRMYTMGFNGATLGTSGPQDLLAVYTGSSKIIAPRSVNLSPAIGSTTISNLRIRLRYLPTTVTSGSGGGAGTIARWVAGDAAATATGRINDTTQATTSGTAVDLWDDAWNTINGFLWAPASPNQPPIIGISGAFIVSLDSTPAALVVSGSVTFEELP